MKKLIKFTVPGEPVGKGRPRFTTQGGYVRTYTPKGTKDYEEKVAAEYRRQSRGERFGDEAEVFIAIFAYFGIPKSATRTMRKRMEHGEVGARKRPDADNIIKSICDALNGVAYRDDAQIVCCYVEKAYSDTPRVEVMISERG